MKSIHIDDAKNGMIVARDINLPNSALALVRKGTALTHALIRRISGCGISSIYIEEEEPVIPAPATFSAPAAPPPHGIEVPFSVPLPKPLISAELRKDAVQGLEEFFATAIGVHDVHESSKIVKRLDNIIEQLVHSLTADTDTLVNINDLKGYDEYTYHHSLSVAVLSIAIAQYCGLDRSELSRIAKTAIMHDIGKTAVPIEIIHKTSKLDDEEFAIIQGHPRAGYDYLAQTGIGDEEIRRAVLYHHEKFNGAGYPDGLKGMEIPLWSRIISVADVYDALTSNRPYRQPMQPSEALDYIMGGVNKDFDFDIVDALVKKMEPYPAGSLVELSNSQIAVVLHTQYSMRPVVKFVDTGEILDLFNDRRYLNVVIRRLLGNISSNT